MAESKIVHFFNSLSEDVKKTLKSLAEEVKVEMAEEAAPAPVGVEVPLQDGTLAVVYGELEVGTEVKIKTPEGEIVAPEGEHILADGTIIVVKKEGEKSVIAEIKPAEEMKAEPNVTESSVAMEAVKSLEAKFAALVDENASLKAELEKLKLNVSKTKGQLAKTVEVVEAMAAVPTAEPVAKNVNKVDKKEKMFNTLFNNKK